jgi:hypothetical protein
VVVRVDEAWAKKLAALEAFDREDVWGVAMV